MDVRADMSLFAGTLSDPLAYGLADVRFGSKDPRADMLAIMKAKPSTPY